MRCELPAPRRCCFCIPLRIGLLIAGYIKIILSVLYMVFMSVNLYFVLKSIEFYKHYDLMFINFFSMFNSIVDVVFHIIFLIGAHKKDYRKIRWYYRYSIYNIIAITILFFINMGILSNLFILFLSLKYFIFEVLIFIWIIENIIPAKHTKSESQHAVDNFGLKEASQLSCNDEIVEQDLPLSRWNCCCVLNRLGLFILVFLKLAMNLGLLILSLLIVKMEIRTLQPALCIALCVAIFIDVVDIFTGLLIIVTVYLKRQRIMEIYYKYSIYIFGSLIILCCIVTYLIAGVIGPVILVAFILLFVLLLQVLVNEFVKSEVLMLRSNKQFRL